MSDFECLPIGTNALLTHLGYEHDGDVWRPIAEEQHLLRDTLLHHERRYVAEVAVVKPARELTYEDLAEPEVRPLPEWHCPEELRGLRAKPMSRADIVFRRCEAASMHRFRVTGECGYPCVDRGDVRLARAFHFPEEVA